MVKHSIEAILEQIEKRELEIKGWEAARDDCIARKDEWAANWLGEKIGLMKRAVSDAKAFVARTERPASGLYN